LRTDIRRSFRRWKVSNVQNEFCSLNFREWRPSTE
jgi:hypothetical protein